MIQVRLTEQELADARDIGIARLATSPGDPKFPYDTRSGRDTHIIGAQAELAFARGLGLVWPARIGTFRKLPDVDPNWEVRWVGGRQVKVAKNDPPGILVAVVTEKPPLFDIHGFVVAGWVQRHHPAVDPGARGWAAHFAPFSVLSPIDPGFHAVCAWEQAPSGDWRCAFCGAPWWPPEG